jgi:hypothetical protein
MERFQPPGIAIQKPQDGMEAFHEAALRISVLPKLRRP